MDPVTRRIDRLGHAVGDVSDRLANSEATLHRARERFLEEPRAPERSRPASAWLLVAACGLLAIVAVLVVRTGQDEALWFELGSQRGVVGDPIAADQRPVDVRFSEGSRVKLEPGTRMRVTQVDARGADLLIEHGTTRTSFERKPEARWVLRAGPFAIRVTGTTFETCWDPAREVLELSIIEGSVEVNGPYLPPGRRVVGGEYLYVFVKEGRMELRTTPIELSASGTADSALPAGELPSAALEAAPELAIAAAPSARNQPAADADDWRKLAQERRYRDAIARIEKVGADAEIARASADELLLLSDAARFTGRPALARAALLAARTRFNLKGRTAFLLGKIAAEQLNDSPQAITWFETYLREQPGGSLGEQALGRLIELERQGDPVGARKLAERYLEQYPSGAYTALARSILAP